MLQKLLGVNLRRHEVTLPAFGNFTNIAAATVATSRVLSRPSAPNSVPPPMSSAFNGLPIRPLIKNRPVRFGAHLGVYGCRVAACCTWRAAAQGGAPPVSPRSSATGVVALEALPSERPSDLTKDKAMVRTIISQSGGGYRPQLDRTRRWLQRITSQQMSDVDCQDFFFTFFQNCWHVTDWLRNDDLVDEARIKRVLDSAEASPTLRICADLANGTKHFKISRNVRQGARPLHVNTTIIPGVSTVVDCIIDDGQGHSLSGLQFAINCIAEWETLLSAEGLNHEQRS